MGGVKLHEIRRRNLERQLCFLAVSEACTEQDLPLICTIHTRYGKRVSQSSAAYKIWLAFFLFFSLNKEKEANWNLVYIQLNNIIMSLNITSI